MRKQYMHDYLGSRSVVGFLLVEVDQVELKSWQYSVQKCTFALLPMASTPTRPIELTSWPRPVCSRGVLLLLRNMLLVDFHVKASHQNCETQWMRRIDLYKPCQMSTLKNKCSPLNLFSAVDMCINGMFYSTAQSELCQDQTNFKQLPEYNASPSSEALNKVNSCSCILITVKYVQYMTYLQLDCARASVLNTNEGLTCNSIVGSLLVPWQMAQILYK